MLNNRLRTLSFSLSNDVRRRITFNGLVHIQMVVVKHTLMIKI